MTLTRGRAVPRRSLQQDPRNRRRILLRCLQGASPTQVRLDGSGRRQEMEVCLSDFSDGYTRVFGKVL